MHTHFWLKPATLVRMMSATLVLPKDERGWKERQRGDIRERDRREYKRPDAGKRPKTHKDERPWKERQRVDIRERDRRGYKRPDAGKRPKTHNGATGLQRLRGYKRLGAGKRPETRRSTCTKKSIATNNESIKREGAFVVKEEQRKCNSVFGCGKCFCDQCYPPGDALGRRR